MPAFGRYEKKGVEKKAPIDEMPQGQKNMEATKKTQTESRILF